MFNFKARDVFLSGFILGAIAVALIVLFVLAFQGRSANIEEPVPAPEEPTPAPEEPTGLPDLGRRNVTIAVENGYLPFNYIDPNSGEPAGWDYEAWDAICGLPNCIPEYVEVAWEDMFQVMVDGQYDAAANGIALTHARAEIVEFS